MVWRACLMVSMSTVMPRLGIHCHQVCSSSGSEFSRADHSKYARPVLIPSAAAARPAATFLRKYALSFVPAVLTTNNWAALRVAIAGNMACSRLSSVSLNASSIAPTSSVRPWPAVAVVGSVSRRLSFLNTTASLPAPR